MVFVFGFWLLSSECGANSPNHGPNCPELGSEGVASGERGWVFHGVRVVKLASMMGDERMVHYSIRPLD